MAVLDIEKGDFLIVSTLTYSIKSVEWWEMRKANNPTFQEQATLDCSTKRILFVEGKRGTVADATTNLASLKCIPIDSADRDLVIRTGLTTMYTLKHTQISNDDGYMVLILEELA